MIFSNFGRETGRTEDNSKRESSPFRSSERDNANESPGRQLRALYEVDYNS